MSSLSGATLATHGCATTPRRRVGARLAGRRAQANILNMFKILLNQFTTTRAPERGEPTPQLATAALFVRAARADGEYAEVEIARIDALLASGFELDAAAAQALRAQAERAEAEASDIVRFTRVLKDALDEDGREKFLEEIWSVVLEDGVRDPSEDGFMRQLAALLYVPDQRANAARLRAARRMTDGSSS